MVTRDEATRASSGDLWTSATAFVDEHPIASVGIAFGIGYVLSGALVSRTTLKVLGFGGRFLLGGIVRQVITGAGAGFLAPVMQHLASERDPETFER